MKVGKVWGETEILLKTPLIEIHRLYIKPNSTCSMHKHNSKNNAFYVESGTLFINVQKNDYDLIDVTELHAREFTTVKSNEYHWFETKDSECYCIEIYYPNHLDGEDIIRKNVGTCLS